MELDGEEITAVSTDSDQVRRRLGMVFQSFNLFPHMSVIQNITLAPIQVHGVSKEQAYQKAFELLDRFGLREKADQFPDRLSGGQQQRVALIRSLACGPRLLLLDEITSALDPVLVNEVLATVRDLKQDGMTMVIATHEMGFARQVADQLCYLHNGRILESGSATEVIDDPKKKETKEFLARVHSAGRL
jgi:polar amino acid transport system ATP-binding protein